MPFVKLHKYSKEQPTAREEIFVNPSYIAFAQPIRTSEPKPGTRILFANGIGIEVWENMSEFMTDEEPLKDSLM